MFRKLTTIVAAYGALALASLLPVGASPAWAENLILPIFPSSAWDGTAITHNCVGTRGLQSCATTFRRFNPNPYIIHAPAPISEQEIAERQQRDKRWEERCKPAIRQDQYGVSRYVYSARGCEFGRLD